MVGTEKIADARDRAIDEFDRAALFRHADRIRNHPDFPQAMRRYTETALGTFEGRPRDAKLICQTARYVTLFFILYLDDIADPDGPDGGASLARLQELVALGPFASASWVKLAVRTFHRTGMIEYRPPGADRRRRPFRPTAHLLATGQRALTTMLEAVALVQPLPGPPAKLARIPGMVESFARVTVQVYLDRGFVILEPFPQIAALLSRDFGHLIFTHLVRTMRTEAGEIVAEAPSADLSRRFGVSRAHVRNLLDAGAEMGVLTVEARGGHAIRLSPVFAEQCRQWVAADLAWMAFLCRASLARLGRPVYLSRPASATSSAGRTG